MQKEWGIFIDGQWIEGKGGILKSINPATEDEIFEVHQASVEDVDRAVESSRKALESWSSTLPEKRAGYLMELIRWIRKNFQNFVDAEVEDTGSTIRKATADVTFSIDCARFLVKEGQSRSIYYERGEFPQPPMMLASYVVREPVGVVAGITPWNFPFIEATWKIFPALITGNTMVLKPASWTSLSTLLLAKGVEEVKLPKGVLNVIVGPGGTVGTRLVEHQDVAKVAFTGSTEVGRDIYKRAADGIKRLTLELGGKGPNIVLDDADLDMAVDGAVYAAFWHCGQVCIAGSRLIILERIYDEVISRVIERVKKIRVGDPKDYSTGMGPVVSEAHMKSVIEYIEIGKKEAKLLAGGSRLPRKGYFLEPTVFEAEPSARIAKEEIFGPVLTILKAKDEAEAINIANDVIYGLSATIWSKNIPRAIEVAKKVKAGTVWINEAHLVNYRAPFGGFKQSGLGRELGVEGLKGYTEIKHIAIDLIGERGRKVWYDMII